MCHGRRDIAPMQAEERRAEERRAEGQEAEPGGTGQELESQPLSARAMARPFIKAWAIIVGAMRRIR